MANKLVLLISLSLGVLASRLAESKNLIAGRAANASLADCLGSKNVPTLLIGTTDFTNYSEPYNLRLPYTPAAIVLPTTAQQVSDAVLCASQSGVKVQAKSGGHSYGSFSLGGKNGSLVIDLEPFNEIVVDKKTFIATVGGGVRLGNLVLGLFNQSQRAVAHGTCPG
jgi:FAD binding domain